MHGNGPMHYKMSRCYFKLTVLYMRNHVLRSRVTVNTRCDFSW